MSNQNHQDVKTVIRCIYEDTKLKYGNVHVVLKVSKAFLLDTITAMMQQDKPLASGIAVKDSEHVLKLGTSWIESVSSDYHNEGTVVVACKASELKVSFSDLEQLKGKELELRLVDINMLAEVKGRAEEIANVNNE